MNQKHLLEQNLLKFMLAGNSIFTLTNTQTNNRVTYKITEHYAEDKKGKPIYFVYFLYGHDNRTDYQYLGTIFGKRVFRFTKASPSKDSMVAKVFLWAFIRIVDKGFLPEPVKFYHAGRCGRCNRLLTVPESIKSGFGATCRELI